MNSSKLSLKVHPDILPSPRGKVSAALCSIVFFLSLTNAVSADVRISNLDTINLANWGGSGDVSADDGVCIYNSAGTDYRIKVEGTGPGSSFELSSLGRTIQLEVQFRGSIGSFTQLSAGQSESFTGADVSSASCGGGTNATIRVRISESNLRSAQHGSYSGTLYITVEPL